MAVPEKHLPRFFEELAKAMEGRPPTDGLFEGLKGLPWSRIKITVKRVDGECEIRFRAKTDKEKKNKTSEKEKQPSYKSLKKRMGATFKELKNEAAEQMPPKALVTGYLLDCGRMTGTPGYGDEDYPAFDHLAGELAAAFKKKDLAGFRAALERMDAAKKECHRKHK